MKPEIFKRQRSKSDLLQRCISSSGRVNVADNGTTQPIATFSGQFFFLRTVTSMPVHLLRRLIFSCFPSFICISRTKEQCPISFSVCFTRECFPNGHSSVLLPLCVFSECMWPFSSYTIAYFPNNQTLPFDLYARFPELSEASRTSPAENTTAAVPGFMIDRKRRS